MKVIAMLVASIVGLASPYAGAEEPGFYLGAGLGKSVARFNGDDFSTRNAAISKSTDTGDTAYKLFGGYNFNAHWAIEAGYVDPGRFAYQLTASAIEDKNRYTFDYKAASWFVAAKGTLPVTGQLDVFGKLGVTENRFKETLTRESLPSIALPLAPCIGYADLNACYPGFSASAKFSNPGTRTKTRADALIAVGVEYKAFKNARIRFEYEDFGGFGDAEHTGRARVTATTLSAVYNF